MPRQPRFLLSQSYYHIITRGNNRNIIFKEKEDYLYSSYNHYANGKEDNLLTDDFFYQGLGKIKQERQLNYQQLLIDKTIQKTYNKDIWGSDNQRYMEKQKINRKMNRRIKVKTKKA